MPRHPARDLGSAAVSLGVAYVAITSIPRVVGPHLYNAASSAGMAALSAAGPHLTTAAITFVPLVTAAAAAIGNAASHTASAVSTLLTPAPPVPGQIDTDSGFELMGGTPPIEHHPGSV